MTPQLKLFERSIASAQTVTLCTEKETQRFNRGKLGTIASSFALAALLGIGVSNTLRAASQTWGANGNSAWYTAGNWAGGAFPGQQGAAASNTDVATFTNVFTGTTVGINMGTASLNLGAVSIDATRTTATNIGNSSSSATGSLRLYGATVNGNANTILRNAGSGLLTLQATQGTGLAMGLVISNATDNAIYIDGSGGVTISSIISGANNLSLNGSGTGALLLSGANSFGNGKSFTINAGIVRIGVASVGSVGSITSSAVGVGGLVLNGGTFSSDTATARTLLNAVTFGGNVTLGNATNSGALTFSANGTLTGDRTLTVASSVSYNGNIGDGGGGFGLTKSGSSTLTLGGGNTYTGATKVSTGTLALASTGDVASSSKIAISAGATLDLSAKTSGYSVATGKAIEGNGAITLLSGQKLSIGGTGTTIAPGTVDSATTTTGTLAITGGLTLASSGKYEFTLNNAAGVTAGTDWDLITMSQALNITATSGSKFIIDINGTGTGFSGGTNYTWTLATMPSTTGFDPSVFSITGSTFGGTGVFSVASTGTALNLVYTAPVISSYTWTGAGSDANWSTGNNWGGTAPTAGGVPIVFAGNTNVVTNNDLAANTAFPGITFDATAGGFTLAGNVVDLTGDVVNNSANSQTISLPMRLSGTARTLNAASASLTVGAIDLNGQNLTFNGPNGILAASVISGTGNVTQAGAGTTTLGAANTFSGTTTVANGTLVYGLNDALGSGAVQVSGGTLNISTFTDTVGSFSISSGSLNGSGTLTAPTYNLAGGTVAANLGTGAATASSGTTALNGTLAADLTVNGGTVNLGAADRLSDTAAIAVSSGALEMGAFLDAVGTFVISGSGTLNGTGTLTAASYSLGGGTLNANLGAGTATAASGSTTLNGTLGANLTVSGTGTVNLGASDRIGNSASVAVAGGTLGLGAFNETVGSFALSGGGTLGGTGALTAATYALQGGTVNAVLGAGAVTVSTGTTVLGSTARLNSASTLAVNSGQLTIATGGSESVASYTQSGGTLAGGTLTSATDYNLQAGAVSSILSGGVGLSKTGSGISTLAAANLYTGTTLVKEGSLQLIGGSDRIKSTTAVVLGDTGTTGKLILGDANGGSNQTLAGLTAIGSGGSVVGGGSASISTLTANIASGSNTFAGTLGGSGTNENSLALVKTGAGVLELSAGNTYTGGTTVSAGTLKLAATGAAGGGSVTMSAGSLIAAPGTTHSNAITIGTAPGTAPSLVAGWDFQTAPGTAVLASSNTPKQYTANFGSGTLYLNGTNGSSNWAQTTELNGLGGTAVNAGPGFSIVTTSPASLALLGGTGNSANGKSLVFSVNLTGLNGLSISYATQGTSTGFNSQAWEYSLNGTTWTPLQTVSSIPTSFATQTLATTNALDGISTAFLRMTVTGATGSSGNNRVDNIQFNTFVATPGAGSGTLGIDTAGAATFAGAVTVNNTATFTAVAGGDAIFTGVVSGPGTVTKTDLGTVTANPTTANGFAPNTLDVNGGTFLVSGTEKIGDSTKLILSGGVLSLSGSSNAVETLGTLTLSGDSILDFGTTVSGSGNTFRFADSSALPWFGTLSIYNWTPSDDHLYFGVGNTGLTSSQLGAIKFYSDAGSTILPYAPGFSGFIGAGEVAPVPEPTSVAIAMGLVGLVGWRERWKGLEARRVSRIASEQS